MSWVPALADADNDGSRDRDADSFGHPDAERNTYRDGNAHTDPANTQRDAYGHPLVNADARYHLYDCADRKRHDHDKPFDADGQPDTARDALRPGG